MTPIKIGKYRLGIPNNQEETALNLYKSISPLVMQQDSEELRGQIIFSLIKAQMNKKQQRIFKTGKIDAFAVLKLSELIGWIWKRYEIEGQSHISPWIQEFKYKKTTYILPLPNMDDVTVNEFAYINMYLDMVAEGDAEAIYGLAALICRPLKSKKERTQINYNGQPRIQFNPDLIDVEKFKKAPECILWNVYDFCLRAQLMIHKRYEIIFSGEKSKGPNFGWLGMVMNIAETGTYGKAKEVEQESLHTICIYTTRKILEQKRHQEELENIKKKHA